ncbi:hypothetical protein I302_100442 [Kwoniella bestiolae CBS 10118]|uniref:Dolichol phosphate-mannose biosynthesis regulatory protein n=1 Tax=Kwoniella bestiolae CBS 10118 TaxID=1296100 RepID=A0A1B9G562_9TREE|nr:dolichyl-phosphate mannosyltransferase polypeptide 2, regulatory subunit [Kwoniella bestiolae CBS 10118]OCF26140.1 dolichyl-phosphate mannosyltransferase polypeptide 2, regulatory subunit [Kwoniella bestiolae CBS 10118]
MSGPLFRPDQATSDKLLGAAMLFVAAFVFIYYTTWALLLPFISPSSPIQSLFPPREWAIKLPLFLLLSGISAIGLFFARVSLSEARKKAAKGGKKV